MQRANLSDVTKLGPTQVRAGANAVHARLAHLSAALGAPPRAASPALGVRRWSVASLVALTLLINAMAVAAPLVTLAVFDNVAGEGAHLALAGLCGAGGLAVVYELMLRGERSRMAADIGVRAAAGLSAAFFANLIQRDARESAGEPVAAHVAKFRALRGLRRFLTGPVTGALLDTPLALVLSAALFIWFGPIGFVPLAAGLALVAAGLLLRPAARRTAQHAARTRAALRVALAEAASKRETLDEIGMAAPWAQRIEMLAADAAERRGAQAGAEAARDAVAHAVAALAVVATIWLGATRVMDGVMTIGGVMAAIMIVWRCITPMEAVFRGAAQVRAALQVLKDARRLGGARFERAQHLATPAVTGAISARGLVTSGDTGGLRALRGVSFDVMPGEIVAVCGAAGSGKSTLLQALLGLVKLESGAVAIDGCDLRNLDPAALRTRVAYAPQQTTLFHGTVAQNIRLLAPGADAAAMGEALARAGVRLPDPQLLDGVDTRLRSGGGGQIDESLRAKIMLAGLYAKQARLYLLDDPGAFLDRDGDRAFRHALSELRGRATVILVTNRPSHMRVCDRIIRLEHGMVVTDGPAAAVLGG